MSSAELLSASETIAYQYNRLGNLRAPVNREFEIFLDSKLVQKSDATAQHLATLSGPIADAREMGFELGFRSAAELGLETMNEITGQWRAMNAQLTFAVVARLPE